MAERTPAEVLADIDLGPVGDVVNELLERFCRDRVPATEASVVGAVLAGTCTAMLPRAVRDGWLGVLANLANAAEARLRPICELQLAENRLEREGCPAMVAELARIVDGGRNDRG